MSTVCRAPVSLLLVTALVAAGTALAHATDLDLSIQALEARYRAEAMKPLEEQSVEVYDEMIDRIRARRALLEAGRAQARNSDVDEDRLRSLEGVVWHARYRVITLESERLEDQREEERVRAVATKPWPEHVKRLVVQRTVRPGMTREQAEAAWGKPLRVQATVTPRGRVETWHFEGGNSLRFTNGRLDVIGTGR
jgi:hypothetical protein